MHATLTAPQDLPERGTPAALLAVEDAAYDALVSNRSLTDGAALAIWEAAQRIGTRDPLISRVLLSHPALLTRAVDRLGTVLTRLNRPDPELLTLAGLLTWATGGERSHALLLLTLAQENGTRHTLAATVHEAITLGLPAETWLTVTADLSLDLLRAAA